MQLRLKKTCFKLGAKAEDVEAAFENSKLYPFQPMVVIQDISESNRLKVLE